MEQRPKVAVLLATHNPNNFIKEQISSIASQESVSIKIYWGDYKSDQAAKSMVRNLLAPLDFVEIEINEPGPAANFFSLLMASQEEYIAFADQDDVWLPMKLINQVRILEPNSAIPSLVHSNSALLVNNKITKKASLCSKHDFESLAFTNCCQGCTLMINGAARRIIVSELPQKILWHDWWIALAISLAGKIYFSEDTDTLYRLHDANLVGIPSFSRKIRNNLSRRPGVASNQINEAIARFNVQNMVNNEQLKAIQNLISKRRFIRLKAAFVDRKRRSNLAEDLLRRILVVVRMP